MEDCIAMMECKQSGWSGTNHWWELGKHLIPAHISWTHWEKRKVSKSAKTHLGQHLRL